MRKKMFWLKTLLLILFTAISVWYLTFVFIMQFFNASHGSNDLLYYFMLVIHLLIIVVCILYSIHKINFWRQQYDVERR